MQIEILFTNPWNAVQCWKVVSIKSNYCDKKTHQKAVDKAFYSLHETMWFLTSFALVKPMSTQLMLLIVMLKNQIS